MMCASLFLKDMQIMGGCYLIAALGSLGIVFAHVWNAPMIVVAVLAFLLRMGSMGGSAATYVTTPPAYPTQIRTTAHGFHFGAGRIGGMLATLWPVGISLPVIMGTYAAANAVCSFISFWEGRILEETNAFDVLTSDLRASDLGKRERSSLARVSNASRPSRPSWFGRPSLPSEVRAMRPSTGLRAAR